MVIMDGIRVVEAASWTYAPVAGAVLAEWGADVIKIEHPESGDPQRGLAAMGLVPTGPGCGPHDGAAQPGKRSVGLEDGNTGGEGAAAQAGETADVFLTIFPAQARCSLGIDVDDILVVNRKIIYVRGSGQGQEVLRRAWRLRRLYVLGPRRSRPTSSRTPTRGTHWPSRDRCSATSSAGSTIAGGISATPPPPTGSAPARAPLSTTHSSAPPCGPPPPDPWPGTLRVHPDAHAGPAVTPNPIVGTYRTSDALPLARHAGIRPLLG